MTTLMQQLGDRMLGRLVPAAKAAACNRPNLISRTCVGCPGTANYLFRIREKWSCCNMAASACTFYSACRRTC